MNTSRACSRSLESGKHLYRQLGARRTLSTAHRASQQPTPLFLDFLAPSWQTPRASRARISGSQLLKLSSRELQQVRQFSRPSPRSAKAVTNPRQDDDGNEMNITISPRAAHRLRAIAEKDQNPELALRVSVESGGCHGFQYLMSLINSSDIDAAEDTVFENDDTSGGYNARVVMDEPSLELLKGSSIDYTMELIGSQFKVTGIPGAKSSCGCGTSFDIAQ